MYRRSTTTTNALIKSLLIGGCFVTSTAYAFSIPSNLYVDDGFLYWQSDSPSINVYENGSYLMTLHDAASFGPLNEGSLYQLTGHDHGNDFTPLSSGVFAGDEEGDDEGDEADDDADDGEEVEFDEARIYFELNDTDGDLGLHALIDGDSWQTLSIEDPLGQQILELDVSGPLAAQGMTEFFFESAEPTFDVLAPADLFARFPEGVYEASGQMPGVLEFESEMTLSHVIPAPPPNIMVSGSLVEVSGGCEEDSGPVVAAPYVVSWDPVMFSHPELGQPGIVEVSRYQVVLEREEPTALHIVLDVDPDVTQLTLPNGLILSGDELKIEVLTIAESNNQSAAESCFVAAD